MYSKMSIHQSFLDFVCDYCSRTFTRKYNLQTHIENFHQNSTCYCEVCDQHFGTPAGLQLHLHRGHNRNAQPYPECDICGRIFARKQNLVSHMITVHYPGSAPVIKCQLCERTFSTENSLKRHTNLLHNPDVEYPTCDYCRKAFRGKQSLITHIQSVHVPNKRINKCNICDRIYTNNRNLKRHIEIYHEERCEFRCDVCPKVYTSNHSLKRHTRSRHLSSDTEEHCCQYCSKNIIGKDNLDAHISFYHRQDEPMTTGEVVPARATGNFVCVSCLKVFDEENILRQHIKTEHSFKTFYKYCKKSLLKQMGKTRETQKSTFYKCEFCNNGFGNVYEFKDHMRISHDKEYCLSTCNVCFIKFYTKETMSDHKEICLPPANVNSCEHCDKLFTDISSLEFHTRIFHPQAQIADSNITSTNENEAFEINSYRCDHCDRVYYSDRSLKHHIKLKHTTDEAMECEYCGKICNNKYYLASHIKIVHNNDTWSKCSYCDKQFKSKRNIRRHIEYTHLGMQRYKCIECETLFKEKRSLRKHVRTKHPNSTAFPQCHICHKRFESAKSCKIHLKLLHSFNMNTFPCDLCSVSFSSSEALSIHFQTKHLAEDEIYKCEECNLVFKGQEKFEQHNDNCHVSVVPTVKQKLLPRCIICMKDFSTRKTLKRHIKNFHNEFDVDELATFGSRKRSFSIDCEDCIKKFNDDINFTVYQNAKHMKDSIIFKCETCSGSYNSLEYFIQRNKLTNFDSGKSKMILSELCTAEMSEGESSNTGFESVHELAEAESTTSDIKTEPVEENSETD